jgi:hypothetical protein
MTQERRIGIIIKQQEINCLLVHSAKKFLLLYFCTTSAQLLFYLISKLPVTVSLFGLKHFLLFKSTECKTNNGFNWSIIVSQSGAEVGWETRWIWNNHDDDMMITTQLRTS